MSNLRYVAWTALAVAALFLIYFAMGVAGYTFSDGAFLNSQPENTRCHSRSESASARCCTTTWTKAPVSGGSSHGAVRSHADEYRVDVDLPDHLVRSWGALRVTDQMPFRMVLRPADAL